MTAYADLAAGLGAHELVPGDLGEVEYMAINSAAYAEQVVRTWRGVRYIQVEGWAFTGRAADVYEAARRTHLDTLEVAARAFEVAAGALASYAVALRDARVAAAAARENFDVAQRALASCGTGTAPVIGAGGVLRPVAPAAPPVTVQGAVAQLESARANARAAGEAAAQALNEAAKWSPAAIDDGGGFHLPSPGDLLHDLKELPHDIVTGPYHLMHGYVSTLARSFIGLGVGQYAGEHGMPGPGEMQMDADRVEMERGAFDTLNLLLLGEGGAAGSAFRAARALAPKRIAEVVAEATGGEVSPAKAGYKVLVPHGGKGILIRLHEEGSQATPYYRVSIPGKQAFTRTGIASSNQTLTHIDIGPNTVEEIMNLIKLIKGGG